jgi:anaerobic magnesium-protoporphyrin IX monomethyl ester cyclase
MNIALLQPPLRDFYLTRHRMSGLALSVVQEMVEEAGHSVALYNFPRYKRERTIPLPKVLSYLAPFIIPDETGLLSGFRQFHCYGPDFHDAALEVISGKPDLVLVALFAWAYGQDALEMAEALKRVSPSLPLGIGGAGVSVDPDRFASSGLFDLILTGEAEKVLPLWFEAGTPMGGFFKAETFSSPEIGGETFRPAASFDPHRGELSLSVSRGCPMSCSFCANRLVHGDAFRLSPISLLLKSMDDALRRSSEEHGSPGKVNKIFFEDDNLSADKGWFREMVAAVHGKYPSAELSAENGIDYRFLNSDDLIHMYRAGFRGLNFSVASVDGCQRESLDRAGSLEHFTQLLGAAQKLNMSAISYFIAGLPGESPDSIIDNLNFLMELPTYSGISLFYPVPGIIGLQLDQTVPFQRALGSSAWPWGGECTTGQLLTAFRLSRLVNLMKKRVSSVDDHIINLIFSTNQLYTFIGKFRTAEPILWADQEMINDFIQANKGYI